MHTKGDENLTEEKAGKRFCVCCKTELVPTIYENGMTDGHWCCPNRDCPRGWLLTAIHEMDGAKEFKEVRDKLREESLRTQAEEEIGRLADFFLKNYSDEIGVGDPAHGESAVDMAIRLLTKDDRTREEIFRDAHPRGLAPGAKNTCQLADPENWPCQYSLQDIDLKNSPGYHCPKTCDHIQIMKDGEAWSS